MQRSFLLCENKEHALSMMMEMDFRDEGSNREDMS